MLVVVSIWQVMIDATCLQPQKDHTQFWLRMWGGIEV